MRFNPFKKEKDPFAHDLSGLVRTSYRPKKQKPWLLRHRWVAVTLAVLVLLMSLIGYGIYRFYKFQGEIQEDIPNVVEAEETQPFNVLLVGSDSRDGLTAEEQIDLGAKAVPGERADTLILAHIDPETNKIIMIQFPRDLYVPLSTGESNKINAALLGGKGEMVKTITDLTGLEINNYAQVNIAGFRDIVDAIGGVDLCITEPIPFDTQTGIEVTQEEIDESPLIHFNGERALRFVRSRNFPTSDFERIRNQQRFLSAAINKVTSIGTIFSPTKITRLMSAAGKNLRVDKNTTVGELVSIGKRFRNFDPENYEAYTAPNFGIGNNEAGSVVLPDLATMEVMFDQIARNESPLEADGLVPPDVDMPSIRVGIYNGTFEEGVAAEAQEQLEAATQVASGTVTVAEIANADRIGYRNTIIRFDDSVEGARQKAEVIARAVPNAEVKEGKLTSDVDVALIVGKEGVEFTKLVQIVPIDIPEPGEVPQACR
jgi:LCP family protein required for cell wall assembly